MNWRWKALLQLVLSTLPFSEHLNYFFQRYVTKGLPVTDAKFIANVSTAKKHIDIIMRCYHQPLGSSTFYEFGAGWDMSIPLAFYTFGVQHQILVDIRNLLRCHLINDTVEKFHRTTVSLGFQRKPDRYIKSRSRHTALFLKKHYGIDYRAPCDARSTGIKACSIDCITSTNTLEHIPLQDIHQILRECYRILKEDGIISFLIDYQDHYSYFDRKISAYNFLQYSDKSWMWYSPALHYQNRLRHRDYLGLFQNAGFEVVAEYRREGTETDLKSISTLALDRKYRAYDLPDLAVRSALVAIRKRL